MKRVRGGLRLLLLDVDVQRMDTGRDVIRQVDNRFAIGGDGGGTRNVLHFGFVPARFIHQYEYTTENLRVKAERSPQAISVNPRSPGRSEKRNNHVGRELFPPYEVGLTTTSKGH